jgi:hypothetical protein
MGIVVGSIMATVITDQLAMKITIKLYEFAEWWPE